MKLRLLCLCLLLLSACAPATTQTLPPATQAFPQVTQPPLIETIQITPLNTTTAAPTAQPTAGATASQPPAPDSGKQNGMSYAAWWPGLYAQPNADFSLAALKDSGANWISLIVTQYQDSPATTTIAPSPSTPTDDDLVHVLRQAHQLGLKVMLKPHVDLLDGVHWRGEIGPGYSEAQWQTWFDSYATFLYHYAELAQANGADQFCVGTEMRGTEAREAQWRVVIAGVRQRYSGPLVYAANHGDETNLTWWDAVDYIGVDAYYTLAENNTPSVAALKAAWAPHVAQLAGLAARWHKTILFTEIGYRSLDGAAQHPWDWQINGAIDLQEQADAYQAAFESLYDQEWFGGFFWWSWGTDPMESGACDAGYSPHDKPAEDVLRSWYGAPPRVVSTVPAPGSGRAEVLFGDALATGWEDWSWGSRIDLASTDPLYQGQHATSVDAQGWGALSLHTPAFDTAPYAWLEFALYPHSAGQSIRVVLHDANDAEFISAPANHFTGQCQLPANTWTLVRIPLASLNALNRSITRVSLQNGGDAPAQFSVDELRLLPAAQ